MSEERVGNCVCGQTFSIPIKRGRPPVRCEACREAYANGTLRDRLASLGVDPDLALRKRIDSHPTSTHTGEEIGPEREDGTEKSSTVISQAERVRRLEMLLMSRNLHISQHRDKW